MMEEIINTRIEDYLSWDGDELTVLQKGITEMVRESEKKRTEVILEHFQSDMSEFREFINCRRNPRSNGDFIRGFDDYELAFLFNCLFEKMKIEEWLRWLKKDAENVVFDVQKHAEMYKEFKDE